MLPVMADFSFGGEKLRGHLLCGGYAGYWLQADQKGKTYWMTDYYVYFNDFNEKREFNSEDQRFTAGVVDGIGLSFEATSHVAFSLESLYYYDLVSYHKGYTHLNDPRYLNTLSVSLGCYACHVQTAVLPQHADTLQRRTYNRWIKTEYK